MKARNVVIVTALLIGIIVLAQSSFGDNLVKNGDFEEESVNWSLPLPLYSVDHQQAHTGKQSLRYHNEPDGPYLLATQGLPLRPGKCYRMSVWVKTEGVQSSDTGATICMEWVGKEGYIGGSYPPGVVGTSDWQPLVFETAPVPKDATGGHVVLYGRQGTKGSAWFDDVEVTELDSPMARFRFADTPAGQRKVTVLAGTRSTAVRLLAELPTDRQVSTGGLQLYAKLHWPGTPKEFIGGTWLGTIGEINVPTESLPFGEVTVEVGLASRSTRRPLTSEFLSLEKKRLLRMEVVAPNPAGVVGVGDWKGESITARAIVAKAGTGGAKTYYARLTLSSQNRILKQSAVLSIASGQHGKLTVSLKGLPFGLYDLSCELLSRDGTEPKATARAVVTHANPLERPNNTTWIGPNRVLMVQGKPFFPMGFYILSSFETVLPADKPYRWTEGKLQPSYYLPILDRLSKSAFNCFIDYGSTMGGIEQARAVLDAARERDLHAIFSVKDLMRGAYWEIYTRNLPWKDLGEATRNVVRELRAHPALIAWYINDEVFQPENWQSAVDVFRNTREVDPWHPTYAVHYDYAHLSEYREACDVIGTDPYTLTGDIGFAARSWRECRKQMPPEQPFWAVVQCFGAGYEFSNPSDTREPTYDEERAATMAAIAEGATGIIYYCFHSLQRSPRFAERFEELNKIAEEVKDLLPILSLPDATKPVQVASGALSALTKQGRGETYVILASTLRTDQEVILSLPVGGKQVRDFKTHELIRTRGNRVFLPFKSLDARVLVVSGR